MSHPEKRGGKPTPDLKVDVGDGVAGLNIVDLEVESKINTGLVLGDILADVLARDVIGTLGDLRAEEAEVGAGEELGDGSLKSEGGVGLVGATGIDGAG